MVVGLSIPDVEVALKPARAGEGIVPMIVRDPANTHHSHFDVLTLDLEVILSRRAIHTGSAQIATEKASPFGLAEFGIDRSVQTQLQEVPE